MLIDNPTIREPLGAMPLGVQQDQAMLDDLSQEALIHIWQREAEQPGQTCCWYLQSCKFHLRDLLDRGRSIDSWKHRWSRASMPAPGDDGDQDSALEQAAVESFPSLITFRDMLQELAARLTPADQIALAYLADGFGVEEIAAKLHCSHQSVSKRRRRIAREASKLGFEPAPLRSKRHPRRR